MKSISSKAAAASAAIALLATPAFAQGTQEPPPDQRSVLLLRILGDMTVEEVARAVGKRPGAVKALQRRGLKRVSRAYPFAGGER